MFCSVVPITSAGLRPVRFPRRHWTAKPYSTASSVCASMPKWSLAYEEAGVRCHFLIRTPALPYQVFARDSSAATPNGPVVLLPQQWWRRGEYAPVIDFYAEAEVPLAGKITAAPVEGGDVMIVEPGSVLIGCSESRTQEPGARQMAAYFEAEGWEARIQQLPVLIRAP